MAKTIFGIALLLTLALFPAPASAGASTTSVVVNGPGIPQEGVGIKGTWPGYLSFVDFKSGPAPEPAKGLPRYVLTAFSANSEVWCTVLYVWDPRSSRALVYLPGPSELGYYVNYYRDITYGQRAGKWYQVQNQGDFQGWADLIRKTLPKAGLDTRLPSIKHAISFKASI